jgi:hypothetical protein
MFMAMTTSTVQPAQPIIPSSTQKDNVGGGAMASVLSAIMLSIYAGQKSRKQLRKLKRKMTWLLVKEKMKSVFSGSGSVDRKTLTIILLAVLIVALVLIEPLAALVLAIIGLILLLAGVI